MSNKNYWFIVYVGYDSIQRKAFFKLYNPFTGEVKRWYDNTGHLPYLLSDASPFDISQISELVSNPEFKDCAMVEKYDALEDKKVFVTKVISKTPDVIGGKGKKIFKNLIPETLENVRVWEANIPYIQCYLYDNNFELGMPYRLEGEELQPIVDEGAEKRVCKLLDFFKHIKDEEFMESLKYWARFLEYPKIEFLRLTLDIEVLSPSPSHIPDPNRALHPVIAVGLKSSDGLRRMYILKRDGIEEGNETVGCELQYFDSEKDLMTTLFANIDGYPFVVTFNGDEFDFKYLYNRAMKLGIPKANIPILIRRKKTTLKYGVHIDLAKFFGNRSLRIYAFRNKYVNYGLDDIALGLLGKGKLKGVGDFNTIPYTELAKYCWQDVELTHELTTYDDELVMKLITILTRISQLAVEDVSRLSISNWIKNFMYNAHRKKGWLIPSKDDLSIKGEIQTKAVIKGKKYRGAIVIEPIAGIHFDTSVIDFASLYPSVVKVRNIGYSTINCKHEECKDNIIPDTTNWICKKNRAITSILLGSLRDIRVKWYKPQSKNKELPEEVRNWYICAQEGIKVILNASYGVFGNEAFDLYCPPVSEAITAYGRESISLTIEKAESIGVKNLYGDTDSIFMKKPTKKQIETLVTWALNEIGIELDVEKEYRYCILSSRKKNYIGVLKNGDVDVKGMTGKKKHSPTIIKDAFSDAKKILSEVESEKDFVRAKRDMKALAKKNYLILKKRKWNSIESLAFNIVLGKQIYAYTKTTPQHVKAALILEQQGHKIEKGDIISFVKTKTKSGVKPTGMAKNEDIDVDKYIEFLRSVFEQIFDSMDVEFDSVIGVTKLERFM